MLVSMTTGITLTAISLLLAILTSGNGAADPIDQNIALLRKGNTSERREAAELLSRLGDQRAIKPLAEALHDADQLVRHTSEGALWRIWHRSGRPDVDARLQEGIHAMERGALDQAIDFFTEVIEMAPDFAEGYNKRATTYYLMQEFNKSIKDCESTLRLNPVHFGALSGTGLNYLGLHNFIKALEYFERAVAVNPNMPQIQEYIKAIQKYLRDQSL